MTSIEAEIKLADDDRQFALKYIENQWKDESDDKKFVFEMGILIGYNKAKSTLYTEEQVREAIDKANKIKSQGFINGCLIEEKYTPDEIIQSLKQPKKY